MDAFAAMGITVSPKNISNVVYSSGLMVSMTGDSLPVMNFKYNVGDKVHVIAPTEENKFTGDVAWMGDWMLEWVGKEVTISRRRADHHTPCYNIDGLDQILWREEWLEDIAMESEIV